MGTMEKVYSVFGKALPNRDTFSATRDNVITWMRIKKEFRTWAQFEYEYAQFLTTKRMASVIKETKAGPKKVVKKQTISKDRYETKK